METFKTVLIFLTPIVSIISLIISWRSYRNAQQSHETSIKPVLVFTRRSSTEWQIENVGNGPALNVLMREMNFGEKWEEDIDGLYPIAAKAIIPLPRLKSAMIISSTYKDVYNTEYTSECGNDLTEIIRGNKYPDWKATRSEWQPAVET